MEATKTLKAPPKTRHHTTTQAVTRTNGGTTFTAHCRECKWTAENADVAALKQSAKKHEARS